MRHWVGIAYKLFLTYLIVVGGGVALFLLILPAKVLIPDITESLWQTYVLSILGMLGVGLVMSLAVGGYISRIFRDLQRVTRAMAAGNLEERIPIEFSGMVGRLGMAINAMAETLTDRVGIMRREKAQLRAILESMQEALVVIDASGDIILSNPAAEHLLGMSPKPLGESLVSACRSADLKVMVDQVMYEGRFMRREISGPPIAPKVVMVHVTPLQLDGESLGVVVVGYDLTPLREVEQLQRDFVANVSHELKTPLTAIRGYSETLLSGALSEPETGKQFITIISRNADQMQRMVQDLLELSTLEAGKAYLVIEEIDLPDLVDELLNHFQPRMQEKQIHCNVTWVPEEIEIRSDRRMLTHVMSNLVDNAVKYCRNEDSISISGRVNAGVVEIEVADTGIGIAMDDMPRVFDRFWRADKSRSRATGGSGLGLAIVKHLTTQLRGTILVKSNEGQGTVFILKLPIGM